MLSNFSEIREAARALSGARVAVPMGHDVSSLEALLKASDSKLAGSIIIGSLEEVKKSLSELAREMPEDMSVIECQDPKEAALKAVSLVSSGKATMLMKGLIKTSIFLKAVLDKEVGLRTGRVLSHVAVVHAPKQDRLVAITDGGMNIRPNKDETIQIILNGADVIRKLGAERAKVALLAAVEVPSEKMPETILWKEIAEEGIEGVDVAGPVAVDGAMDPQAAMIKKMTGPVAGCANVLVTPDIACGNIFAKGFMYMTNTDVGGLIAGAGAPIVMLSRSDTAQTKLNSLALGAVIAGAKL